MSRTRSAPASMGGFQEFGIRNVVHNQKQSHHSISLGIVHKESRGQHHHLLAMDTDQANPSQNLRKREANGDVAKKASLPPPVRKSTTGANSGRVGTLDLEAQNAGGFKGWYYALMHPNKAKPSKSPPLRDCFMNIVKYSWLNILLAFIPVSWALHFAHQGDTLIFVFSFLSIIPLAALLGFATEELALRVGPTLGGLLNATVSLHSLSLPTLWLSLMPERHDFRSPRECGGCRNTIGFH